VTVPNVPGNAPAVVAPRVPAPAATNDSRDFWEVWSEDVGRTKPTSPEPAESVVANATPPTAVGVPALSGFVRLYVNLGRKDGVTPELVAELLSASGGNVPVSDVELMNTHSYVNVAPAAADALCASMNGRAHNGRAVVCETARPPRRR
jgi:DbpA RNA binding domain